MTSDISLYGQLSPMKPSQLAGFKIGDLADAPSLGRVEIIELIPPSLLLVRTSTGATCKCGWRALQRIPTERSKS